MFRVMFALQFSGRSEYLLMTLMNTLVTAELALLFHQIRKGSGLEKKGFIYYRIYNNPSLNYKFCLAQGYYTKQTKTTKHSPCYIECLCGASVDININLCCSFVERIGNGRNLSGTGFSFWPNCILFVFAV